MEDCQISVLEEGYGWCAMRIQGEATDRARPVLEETLVTRAREGGTRSIILQCDALDFIDSCGLGLLFRVYSTLKKKGGSLVLTEANANIKRLLAITNLDKLIPTAPTMTKAKQMVGADLVG